MRNLLVAAAFSMIAFARTADAGGMSNDLLLSSTWCHFTYNKNTGYSHSRRVRFNANGTYSTGSRGEGWSSGSAGSVASQHDSTASGLWRVTNGELFMSEGRGALEHVQTVLKRNSNGYPIIVADGAEYSQCR